ncbi:hypothetical protein [Tunturiibacter gelidoferens]|uniref:Uncharacterized protein n=1 Tax=Tunturiibacter lichenicola TaxID=2051959 RepID=A0A7Y9T3G0_9BACT|nr:hypothetical protein [Edaphobacter lichenicola]NYF52257.1 hypothetical protein [Edaphobacter lichenicola]
MTIETPQAVETVALRRIQNGKGWSVSAERFERYGRVEGVGILPHSTSLRVWMTT